MRRAHTYGRARLAWSVVVVRMTPPFQARPENSTNRTATSAVRAVAGFQRPTGGRELTELHLNTRAQR